MTAVFRYAVPVDDRWHDIALTRVPDLVVAHEAFSTSAPILHVDVRDPGAVEFWCEQETDKDAPREARSFRVFGTGMPVSGKYCGTALSPVMGTIGAGYGTLVWHLYEAL